MRHDNKCTEDSSGVIGTLAGQAQTTKIDERRRWRVINEYHSRAGGDGRCRAVEGAVCCGGSHVSTPQSNAFNQGECVRTHADISAADIFHIILQILLGNDQFILIDTNQPNKLTIIFPIIS